MSAQRGTERADDLERGAVPDPSLDHQMLVAPADDMEPVRLTEPVRPWAAEPRSRCEDESTVALVERLEGASADRGALVDMPTEDEMDARIGERAQAVVPILQRELARGAPGSARKVVVEDGDPKSVRGCIAECGRDGGEA